MSKKLIIADNTISNYETGHSAPNFDTIKVFLDVCNFEIQFIDKEKIKYIVWKSYQKKWIFK